MRYIQILLNRFKRRKSEENFAGLLLNFGRGGERYARGVAAFCSHYHLCGPGVYVAVPYVYRIVVQFAGGSYLLLKICVLLHCVSDFGVSLEVGIVFEGDVYASAYGFYLTGDFVAGAVVSGAVTGTVSRYLRHRGLIQVYCLIEKPCAVLQNYHALFEIVIYLRGVVLEFLLELGEIVARLYLHEQEHNSRNYAEYPQYYLENCGAYAHLYGQLFFYDGYVAALLIYGTGELVEFVSH